MTAIPIQRPWFGPEELEAVRRVLASGWVTQGPVTEQFERAFAQRISCRYAVAVNSCASALHLALVALGIGAGDEVVVPAFTHCATANAVEQRGALVRFVDIDPATYNLDPAALEEALTPRTKAMIVVHLFGLSADLEPILAMARRRKLAVVEDAACAHGALYRGRAVGSFGDAGCFSFHPRKVITTGEGGMLTTDRPEIYEQAARLRSHGEAESDLARHQIDSDRLPDVPAPGYNYRMTDLQAAVGLAQIGRLDEAIQRRRSIAASYTEAFSRLEGVEPPVEPHGYRHVYQSYVIRVDPARLDRGRFVQSLREGGVSTRPGTQAVHTLSYYQRKYGLRDGDCPQALRARQEAVTLPLYPQMTEQEQATVIEQVKRAWASAVLVKVTS